MLCMYYNTALIDTDVEPYYNIQCGEGEGRIRLDMQGDLENNELSENNKFWSEITGLYWAWKNIEESTYVGLTSYRRFFNFKEGDEPVEIIKSWESVQKLKEIDFSKIDHYFSSCDVITPIPYTYAWSIQRVCEINYYHEDFKLLESFIGRNSHDYYASYKKIMYHSNTMIGHNMFIMKWADFNHYCEWVFSILIPLSKVNDASDYPKNKIRVFGYMHELLLAVYIDKHNLKQKYSQIMFVDDTLNRIHFNDVKYRVACEVVYNISKLLGPFYPHHIYSQSRR